MSSNLVSSSFLRVSSAAIISSIKVSLNENWLDWVASFSLCPSSIGMFMQSFALSGSKDAPGLDVVRFNFNGLIAIYLLLLFVSC